MEKQYQNALKYIRGIAQDREKVSSDPELLMILLKSIEYVCEDTLNESPNRNTCGCCGHLIPQGAGVVWWDEVDNGVVEPTTHHCNDCNNKSEAFRKECEK